MKLINLQCSNVIYSINIVSLKLILAIVAIEGRVIIIVLKKMLIFCEESSISVT